MFNNNLQGGLKKIAMLLALSLFTTTVSMSASADLVSTEQLSAQQEVEKVRNEVKNYIARDEVREKMLELGVSHADVDQRIDNLTDQEVMELYEGMDSMPAGEGVLGVVISLLVIFILLDVAGVTDIFPAV
ncbi:MAG: PA2779 family protein [Gammaproteobacteria bacterium]